MRAEPSLFAADVMLIADSGNIELGTPTVTTSLRGTGSVLVTVRTLAGPVHSGMYGGAAPDALAALISMLATLRDAEGDDDHRSGAEGTWPAPTTPSNGSALMPASSTASPCSAGLRSPTRCGRGRRQRARDRRPVGRGATAADPAHRPGVGEPRVPTGHRRCRSAGAAGRPPGRAAPVGRPGEVERRTLGEPFAARTDGPAYDAGRRHGGGIRHAVRAPGRAAPSRCATPSGPSGRRDPPHRRRGACLPDPRPRRERRSRRAGPHRAPGPVPPRARGAIVDRDRWRAPGAAVRSRVTILDVAAEADVSMSTVSSALNERPGVSAATRARVVSVAERLGSVPCPADAVAEALEQARLRGEPWFHGASRRPSSRPTPSSPGFIAGVEVALSPERLRPRAADGAHPVDGARPAAPTRAGPPHRRGLPHRPGHP